MNKLVMNNILIRDAYSYNWSIVSIKTEYCGYTDYFGIWGTHPCHFDGIEIFKEFKIWINGEFYDIFGSDEKEIFESLIREYTNSNIKDIIMVDKPSITVTMEEALAWVRQGKKKIVDSIVVTMRVDPDDNSFIFIQNRRYELRYVVSPELIHTVAVKLNIGVVKGTGPTFNDALESFKENYKEALYQSLSQPVELDPATEKILEFIDSPHGHKPEDMEGCYI